MHRNSFSLTTALERLWCALFFVPLLMADAKAGSDLASFDALLERSHHVDILEWIPEKKVHVLKGRVNGTAARFKLDSGAVGSLLTWKSANALKLKLVDFGGSFTGVASGGKMHGTRVELLELGARISLEHQRMPVIDLTYVTPVDGLVAAKAMIDYRGHRLLTPRSGASFDLPQVATEAGLTVVRMEREGCFSFITLYRGKDALRLLVDTGAERSVLKAKAAERLQLALTESPDRVVGAGNGSSSAMLATVDLLRVADKSLRGVSLLVADLKHLDGFSKQPLDGIFGSEWLSAAGALFDISRGLLVMPTGDISTPPGVK
jgi:predicted aspartyl protease